MFEWIASNISAVIILDIIYLVKSRKKGKNSCGGNCAGCTMCGGCCGESQNKNEELQNINGK